MTETVRAHPSHSRRGTPFRVRRFTRKSKLNFRSKEAYRKWRAYDFIHNPKAGQHPVEIDIRGREVKPARHVPRGR